MRSSSGITLFERRLQNEGYRSRSVNDYDEAKKLAKELRSQGYRARAHKFCSSIPGCYSYGVYYKKIENK